jgi:hypothetical protein
VVDRCFLEAQSHADAARPLQDLVRGAHGDLPMGATHEARLSASHAALSSAVVRFTLMRSSVAAGLIGEAITELSPAQCWAESN